MINKDKLYNMYWDKKMNQKEVGEKLNISQSMVSYYLKKYNIKTRNSGTKILNKISKNKLKELYIDKEMSYLEIANKCNISISTVHRRMKEYNIKAREFKTPYKSHEQFREELKEIYNGKFILLSSYKGTDKKVKIKCNDCGYIRWVTPHSLLLNITKYHCPNCYFKNKRYTTKEFKQKVNEVVGNEYSVLGEYNNNRQKILMKHNKCGYKWKVLPSHFTTQGARCPKCHGYIYTKSVKKIVDWLNDNNINFKREHTFPDCRNEEVLLFDLAIFKDNKLIFLIEYDGRQHFEPIEYFGGEETFEERQKRDKIKDNYCKENNIPLLRIPYLEKDNIEEILENELRKHNLLQSEVAV